MLNVHSIELTSVCNLQCVHCPSASSVYPRGWMTPETFDKALDCTIPASYSPDSPVTISGFGESLLHPQLKELFDVAANKGVYIAMPTNGLLLTPEKLRIMADRGLVRLEVSIHTKTSLKRYKEIYDIVRKEYPYIQYLANVVEHYKDILPQWLQEVELTPEQQQSVLLVREHNWSRNDRPETDYEKQKWQSRCVFLKQRYCVIRWDGRVYTCCVDSEGINYIGHINDFASLTYEGKEFHLCHKCSPAWFTGSPLGSYLIKK